MTPFVVDANAIHAFQKERISASLGPAHEGVTRILTEHCIALDEGELCYTEWLACAAGTAPYNLADWVADELVAGRIQLFQLADNTCRRKLSAYGLPQSDHKWVRLAIGSGGKKLVTEDVDFFDPTKKTAPAAAKARIKHARSGACAKSLKKDFGVSVMCIIHVCDECDTLAT